LLAKVCGCGAIIAEVEPWKPGVNTAGIWGWSLTGSRGAASIATTQTRSAKANLEVVITDLALRVFWTKEAIPGGLAIPDLTIGTPVTTHEATGALVDTPSGRPTLSTNSNFILSICVAYETTKN